MILMLKFLLLIWEELYFVYLKLILFKFIKTYHINFLKNLYEFIKIIY